MANKIITYKDKDKRILSEESLPVTEFDQNLLNELEKLKKTIRNQNRKEIKAVGLAAPQIGVQKRIFVALINNQLQFFINPEVKPSGPEEEKSEGCLSFPELFIPVKRPLKVRVKYQDLKGNVKKLKTTGFSARIILHEIDHLNGILLSDKPSFKKVLNFSKEKNVSLKTAIEKLYGEE